MTNDAVIIRHARNAIDMVLNGAIRQIESQHADAQSVECQAAIDNLMANAREEIDSWERPDGTHGDS